MKLTKENFPEILKSELKKRNLTHKKFAELVGVSPATIDNWLYQKTPPGMIGVVNFFIDIK